MDPRLFPLLLGIFTALFMDEGDRVLTTRWIRFCNKCDHYNGTHCIPTMRSCWKINALIRDRSCRTDHFYFNDRFTGRYLYRHSKLSCDPCEEGMLQVFHDLLRETFCCTGKDRCNDPEQTMDTLKEYVSLENDRVLT